MQFKIETSYRLSFFLDTDYLKTIEVTKNIEGDSFGILQNQKEHIDKTICTEFDMDDGKVDNLYIRRLAHATIYGGFVHNLYVAEGFVKIQSRHAKIEELHLLKGSVLTVPDRDIIHNLLQSTKLYVEAPVTINVGYNSIPIKPGEDPIKVLDEIAHPQIGIIDNPILIIKKEE